MMSISTKRILIGLAAISSIACGGGVRRFPLADPLWEDNDRNHVPERPSSYYSGLKADAVDQTIFRPLARLFAFPLPGEAANANSMDEVANSSWFTNRIGFYPMTPEELGRGPCTDPPIDVTEGPWVVVEAKPNGYNPGFFIKAPNGRKYLLKADGRVQPGRNTSADVIGSKFIHAAGFSVPCYQIAYFDPKILQIDPKATAEDALGNDRPITNEDVDRVLSGCFRLKNGLVRAGLSQFVDGKPIGPFRYQGTRSDDPNDVIPHEDRRELRGAKLLMAWLGHFDSREQNSLDVWVNDNGKNYIKHHYIDFGSSFGSRWPWDALSRRMGFSYYLDVQHVFEDLVTFGLIRRPWEKLKINDEAEIFGYYEWEQFDPENWRGGYPNPSFQRTTPRDALWMIRIMSNFSDEHIAAAIKMAKLSDPRAEAYLNRAMRGRRDKIFQTYLTKYISLHKFVLVRRTPGDLRQSLCFEDLAIKHDVVDSKPVLYKMRFYGGEDLETELGWLQFSPDPEHPHRSCVALPIGHKRPADLVQPNAPDDDPMRYGVMRIFVHQRPTLPPTASIDLHFYDRGPEKGFVLVGLERPPEPTVPADY